MKNFKLAVAAATLFLSFNVSSVSAHCEIPCGVYDDAARFSTLMEHAKTIEKSMIEINKLSEAAQPNYHSIARWTANKEEHAQKVQKIVSTYFLTQRVKVPANDADEPEKASYARHTTMLHQLLVAAMKAKQTTDVSHVKTLRDVTESYKTHYFAKHGHAH